MDRSDFIKEIEIWTNEMICALIKTCFDLERSAKNKEDRFACGEAGEMISHAVYGKPADEVREFVKSFKRPKWLDPLETKIDPLGKWNQLTVKDAA